MKTSTWSWKVRFYDIFVKYTVIETTSAQNKNLNTTCAITSHLCHKGFNLGSDN